MTYVLRRAALRERRLERIASGHEGRAKGRARPAARRTIRLLALAWLASGIGPLRADFSEPELLAEGQAFGLGHALGIDQLGALRCAYVSEGALWLHTRSATGPQTVEVDRNARQPTLGFLPFGLVVGYVAQDDDGTHSVRVRSFVGAQAPPPETIFASPNTLVRPVMQLARGGQPVLAWEERGQGPPRIWARVGTSPAQMVGVGTDPLIEIDRSGRIQLYFRRGPDPYRATDVSQSGETLLGPPELLWNDLGIQGAWSSATLDGWIRHLLFTSAGSLWLAEDSTGAFTRRQLVSGGVSSPSIRITASGLIVITYAKDGDVWAIVGNRASLTDPARIAPSDQPEMMPQIDADSVDQLYAIFRRGDALYVTTNASPPRASFSIEPAHGEAPLRVRFRDESTGGATGWLWDFGDGHTSTLQNPEHVFAATGEYTVTLTVSSPAGPSALTHTGKVLAVEPRHKVWIAPTRAFAGQREIRIPVLATTEVPLQGFQIAATFDATRLQIHRVDFEATNLAGLKPELTVFTQSNDPREPYVTVGVLIDVEPPFNRRVLPPGRSMRLVNLVADVLPSAPEGEVAMVELRHGTGRPAIDNIFVVQASSLVPSLPRTGGVLVDVFRFPPPRFFIRGDVDRNGEVALSDPIRILGHLFLGDPEPDCYDAADATDDGTLDLSDALFLLNFLFRGGIYPPPPGPDPGLDPTPDRFPDCPLRF